MYLVRRKNSDEIKEAKAGSDKRSTKLTDIIPFGEYNIGNPTVETIQRSVVTLILITRKKIEKAPSINFQAKVSFGRQPFRSLFYR